MYLQVHHTKSTKLLFFFVVKRFLFILLIRQGNLQLQLVILRAMILQFDFEHDISSIKC